MTDSPTNDRQARYWEDRSASWIAAEEWTELVAGPFGRRALDALALAPGERVLDVGCGTGPTTVELARRVAPGGTAVGVDIAPSMLEAARARASAAGIDNAEFAVRDAQSDELGAGTFDAVFSRFGVMFFADPVAAFSNLRAALRDGGRLAFACWQDVFVNEWMLTAGAAVVSVTGELPPMPGPGEPGPFSMADPALVERLLDDAGFRSIAIAPHAEPTVVDADGVGAAVEAVSKVGAVREALEANDDPVFQDQIRAAVRDAFMERVHDGQLRLGAAALVVTAISGGR